MYYFVIIPGPVKLESSGNKAGGNSVEYLRPLGLSCEYLIMYRHLTVLTFNNLLMKLKFKLSG